MGRRSVRMTGCLPARDSEAPPAGRPADGPRFGGACTWEGCARAPCSISKQSGRGVSRFKAFCAFGAARPVYCVVEGLTATQGPPPPPIPSESLTPDWRRYRSEQTRRVGRRRRAAAGTAPPHLPRASPCRRVPSARRGLLARPVGHCPRLRRQGLGLRRRRTAFAAPDHGEW